METQLPKQNITKSSIVELKDMFDSEPKFTQWLSRNLDYLDDYLDLDLVSGEAEVGVGRFKCDIVANTGDSEEKAIIENQFEKTNHDHMGKLITYAAGIGARYVIWIAPEFTDEHVAAMEWLNQNITVGDVSFFGIKLEFIKIDGSAPAPNFSVVVKPNDSVNRNRDRGEHSAVNKARYDLFEEIIEEYSKENSEWTKTIPGYERKYVKRGGGKILGIYRLSWEYNKRNNAVLIRIMILTGNNDQNKEIFEKLKDKKDYMEKKLGTKLEFTSPRIEYYISTYKDIKNNLEDLADDEKKEVVTWMVKTMTEMIDMIKGFGAEYASP